MKAFKSTCISIVIVEIEFNRENKATRASFDQVVFFSADG